MAGGPVFIIRGTEEKGTAGGFIIWVSCIFLCLLCGFNCGLAAFSLRNTRVSRARQRGMSETATSPQDATLCAGSPVNLPYPWIGFHQWHEEEENGGKIYAEPERLTLWFICLFQLVIINRFSHLGTEESRLTFWPPSRCQTTCAFLPFETLSLFFSDSSFIFLAALDGAQTPWILPVFMGEKASTFRSPYIWCSPLKNFPEVTTFILLSSNWFLTQKQSCIHS